MVSCAERLLKRLGPGLWSWPIGLSGTRALWAAPGAGDGAARQAWAAKADERTSRGRQRYPITSAEPPDPPGGGTARVAARRRGSRLAVDQRTGHGRWLPDRHRHDAARRAALRGDKAHFRYLEPGHRLALGLHGCSCHGARAVPVLSGRG